MTCSPKCVDCRKQWKFTLQRMSSFCGLDIFSLRTFVAPACKRSKRTMFLSPRRCLAHTSAPGVSAFRRDGILLGAHSTAYKLEDYSWSTPWGAGKFTGARERVTVWVWVSEARLARRLGARKQPCVQHGASGCESLRETRLTPRSFTCAHI